MLLLTWGVETDGHLFPNASETDIASLRQLGLRWQTYIKDKRWIYQAHPFWVTGWTYWDLKNECPDLWLGPSSPPFPLFLSPSRVEADWCGMEQISASRTSSSSRAI